ncbi:unnamed protein product [Phaedon cochleariae]|uniref:DUF4817 domain-containing protein n=1 Tax=Phaedon cochleariae TaxID=80249 RepID=A0A9N9X149_PHACE|nr:unnamed protein product [Phaedon cochleariae]
MPMGFSTEKYEDIYFAHGFCNGNAEAAVREYRNRFPRRRVPNARFFINTHSRFCQFGLRGKNEQYRNNGPLRRNDNNYILRFLDVNQQISSIKAAQQL